ncbi:MAG: tripartite tricarboxylate transporter substrate binding protein [Variibacter sp.]|nr:tripartite tricarboxylate transporter substrate binding protein [Variibacter sp.]
MVGGAQAQGYPERPITLIIPFAPGGGTDAVARGLGPALSAKIGQSIVIENVSGGAGNIAATRVSRATPDGYTLIMHNVALALNMSLFRRLPFDAEKDFVPIAFINSTPLVHVGRTSIPATTLPELAAWMKKNTAKYANPGVGSTGHITGVMLARAIGAEVDFIPYRGGGPALQDVIGGHVDLTNVTLQNAIEPVNGGLVKGFGITSAQRSKAIPQVPSVVEQFGPNVGIVFWNLLLAPAGTPKPVIDRIHAALEAAYTDKDLMASWEKAGLELYPPEQRTPEAARRLLRQEIERMGVIVRENRIEAPQ